MYTLQNKYGECKASYSQCGIYSLQWNFVYSLPNQIDLRFWMQNAIKGAYKMLWTTNNPFMSDTIKHKYDIHSIDICIHQTETHKAYIAAHRLKRFISSLYWTAHRTEQNIYYIHETRLLPPFPCHSCIVYGGHFYVCWCFNGIALSMVE